MRTLRSGALDDELFFGAILGAGGEGVVCGRRVGIDRNEQPRRGLPLMRARHQYIWSSGFSRTRVHDRPRRCIIDFFVLMDTNAGLE
jgi:hypothetical protein